MHQPVAPSKSRTDRPSRSRRAASRGGGTTQAAVALTLEPRLLLAVTVNEALALATDSVLRGPNDHGDIWQPLNRVAKPSGKAKSHLRVDDFGAFRLDAADLWETLSLAPMEFTAAAAKPLEVSIPAPDGGAARFAVVETMLMDPALAAQFADVKTYRGQGIDDPAATVRLDYTPLGFHAQVISPDKTFYIDPYWHRDTSTYASYWRSDVAVSPEALKNLSNDILKNQEDHDHEAEHADVTAADVTGSAARSSGTQLRTYRTAVAATGEYTSFHGGTVAAGQAAIVTAVNRVSGIYETELSIRLQLIANNSSLVYTNKNTDPYSNSNGSLMLSQNQSNIDTVIGSANYDIGHVFSTGGGGVAGLGVVGVTGQKAKGVTGLPSPTGDAFYVDYVAHEMGHQFGGNHTFNTSSVGSNRNGPTAYEPGSGSTIMAYAGITGANSDLQTNSDPYFAFISFDEIIKYVDVTRPLVGTRTNTGNAVPTVDAGIDRTIPTGTPFALTAVGADADAGDALTYSWEQADLGPAALLTAADQGTIPLFRVYNPTSSPTRTFPRLESILAGSSTTAAPFGGAAERLPTVARVMDFRVTVRDNRSGGGGVNIDDMVVNVVNTGAAFLVTSHNSSATLAGGSTQNVTWSVAGTTGNGINAANVNIRLSTDGGQTFPTLLATNVANDGSENVQLPFNLGTTTARIKVEPTDNIFFDINNANFTITNVPAATGAISGKTFHDFDNDGAFDAGEAVLGGVTVYLDADNDGVLDVGETNTTTNASGDYSFTSLANGTYNVKQVPFSGFNLQTPNRNVVIGAGESFTGQDFANTPTGAIVFTGTAAGDNYLLRRSGDTLKYEILIGGVLTHVIPGAGVTSFTFDLAGGNDSLTVDYANTFPIPAGGFVKYDGGGNSATDTDSLTVTGSGNADTIAIYRAESGGAPANAIVLDDLTGSLAAVESITVNGNAGADTLTTGPGLFAPVTYNGGTESDTLVYTSSPANDTIDVDDNDITDLATTVTFGILENLTVNAGIGFDTVNVATGFGAAALTIDLGDGNDTANINARDTSPVTVNGGANDDKLVTALGVAAPIAFDGGANNDTVEFNGSNGTETINVTATTIQKQGFVDVLTYSLTESLVINALASTDTINASITGAGPTTVTLDAGTEADTFNVTPSSAALFRVIGGAPTTPPGDTLNINQAGAIQTTHGPSGEAGFQEIGYSNRLSVRYKEIETLGSGVEQPPTIGSLTDSPDPVVTGDPLTLTANAVADPNGGTVTVAFYRESNDVAGLQVGSDAQVGTDSDSPYSVIITAPTPGAYTYYAQATDQTTLASNVVSTTNTVIQQTSATPAAPDLTDGSDTGLSASDDLTNLDNSSGATALTFTVSGTVAGATVSLFADGVLIGSAVGEEGSTDVTTNGSVDLADGSRVITARQTEPGKFQSPASTGLTVTIDTVAPAAPSAPDLDPASDAGVSDTDDVTNDTTPTFNGTSVPATTPLPLKLLADGVEVGSTSSASGSWTMTSSALAGGTYGFTATIADAAGNVSAESAPLSVTIDAAAPTITQVFVAGTAWTTSFRDFLASSGAGEAAFGYRLTDALHADELPWTNLNQVSVRFGEHVDVAADDLVIRGVNVATYGIASFTYDAATFTATWTLTASIAVDKLLLDLDADLATGVTDVSGNALDGEWMNPTETTPVTSGGADTYPSGDGTPGGDFRFRMNVLPGDVNRSGGILGNDVTLVRNAQGYSPGVGLYTIFKDVNGSGGILGNDVTLVRNRQGITLPAGEPLAPASASASASTSTSTSTSTRDSLFASGASSRSAMRLLAQRFDLLGDEVEQPLVA